MMKLKITRVEWKNKEMNEIYYGELNIVLRKIY